MQPGSVVQIYASSVGYRKYHLCLCLPSEDGAGKFLFINSEPRFKDLYVIDDTRLNFLPRSRTGKSCFSFSMVPRYSETQLQTFQAEVLGTKDHQLAIELRAHCETVTALSKKELEFVKTALDEIVLALDPPF